MWSLELSQLWQAMVTGVFSGDGGPATSATLRYPVGAAVDAAGNLFIADTDNDRIRKVSPQSSDIIGPRTSNFTAIPNPVAINNAVTLSGTVSDATTGGSAVTSAQYNINGGPFSSMLGTFNQVTVKVSASTPAFTTSAVYTICAHGTDSLNNVGASECLLLPVYDPNGGFVTGAGLIESPAGAFAAAPNLAGKAIFGFVSKYVKGANAPVGDTEFQFRMASFVFRSNSYEWLVISGPKAQYKGTGTVNGADNYGFLLTATDGQVSGGGGVDKFRIKVWDKATGGVVYDNVMGASDNVEAADPQAIAGGNIVIQAN